MAGVYIHIPFCRSRCVYCDFYSTTLLEQRSAYVEALSKEIDMRLRGLREPIRTIYFGGGTPSQLKAEDIVRLIAAIGKQDAEEITIEMNPGDADREYLRTIRSAGVNRLSIGIQSLHEERLKLIGRRHTAGEAREAVNLARAEGFDNISLDLMYGLPGQTKEEWNEDIDALLALKPEHISAYCLQWEEGTRLMQMLQQGLVEMADEELERLMYDMLIDKLHEAGYVHYEVSNFARAGYESKHNSSYWNDSKYIGLGAGAHSYDGNVRSSNVADINRYIAGAEREEEVLNERDKYNERVMLGLRTCSGIERSAVSDQKAVERMLNQDLLCENGQMIVVTRKGLHILNRIIETLMI